MPTFWPHIISELGGVVGNQHLLKLANVQSIKEIGHSGTRTDFTNYSQYTPPNSEIICDQNVGTKVVCGIIFFFEKKAMLKI